MRQGENLAFEEQNDLASRYITFALKPLPIGSKQLKNMGRG